MNPAPEELDRRLREAAERRAERDRVTGRVEVVEAELLRSQQLAERWRREVGVLAENLRDLRGFRPLAFLRGLFGSHGESRARLDRELRDAKDAFDEADAQIPALESELRDLRGSQGELADASQVYEAALGAKEQWLREQSSERAAQLEQSAILMRAATAEVEALDAFISSGRQAEGELIVAKEVLREARMASGAHMVGGIVATAGISHRKVDTATRHLDRAAKHMRDMSDDLSQRGDVLRGIELRTGTKLANVLLDSLSVDLFVQRQILSAFDDVTDTIDRVRQSVWAAEKQRQESAEQLQAAQAERERFIEQAG